MPQVFRRSSLVTGIIAVSLSLLAPSAQASTIPLPVQNLTFTDFTGFAPKTLFSAVNPVGWTGGMGLISIDAPGTATVNSQAHGNAYPVYGPFLDPPSGGNFIQADGNPASCESFNQVINGLTIGQDYSLTFWQAAGQQVRLYWRHDRAVEGLFWHRQLRCQLRRQSLHGQHVRKHDRIRFVPDEYPLGRRLPLESRVDGLCGHCHKRNTELPGLG